MSAWILMIIIVVGVVSIVAMLFFAVRGIFNPAADPSRKMPPDGDGGTATGAVIASQPDQDSGNWFTNFFGGGDGGGGGFDGGGGGGDGGGGGG